jgi:hypothetical protein
MPSSVTHAYFGLDLYDRLNVDKRKLLKSYKNHLKTFAQGPDVLFFYKLFCPKYGKNVRLLGHYMQRSNTQDFFINLITEIKKSKLNKNPEVLSFLYGFISHYVLDMTMHPYIIYKTGMYDKKNKSSYKYAGEHAKLELYIDAYLIKIRNKVKPSSFKTHQFCFPVTTLSNKLKTLIDNVFDKTFNKKGMGKTYQASIKHTKMLYRMLRNDHTGIKKQIYSLIDLLPINFKMKAISYHVKLNKNDYYLNLSKDFWNHPLDKNLVCNYSVIELYSIALNETVKLVNEVDKVLSGKCDLEHLKKLFPNLSYLSGFDCKLGYGTYYSY